MTEYDRRAALPSASFAQFCLELLAFVAAHPALREASRSEQLAAWMADAAETDHRH
jgi:hypothetical protein